MPSELDDVEKELSNDIWDNRDRIQRLEAVLVSLIGSVKDKKEPITGEKIEEFMREEGIIDG